MAAFDAAPAQRRAAGDGLRQRDDARRPTTTATCSSRTAAGSGGRELVVDRRGQQRVRLAHRRDRLRRRRSSGSSTCSPRRCSAAAGSRCWPRLFVAFDGDELRDEPDRHERHLRGDLHRRRATSSSGRSGRADGGAAPGGPCRWSASSSAWRRRANGSASTRSPACWCSSWRGPRSAGSCSWPAIAFLLVVGGYRRAVAVPRPHARGACARAARSSGVRPIRLDVGDEPRRAAGERRGRGRHRSGLRARLRAVAGREPTERGRVRVRLPRARCAGGAGRRGSCWRGRRS